MHRNMLLGFDVLLQSESWLGLIALLHYAYLMCCLCLIVQWSFGIVLWELFTRGITPYPDVDNAGILAHLTEGKRMKKPKQSPEAV